MATDDTHALQIEAQVGHPGEKWTDLQERVQADGVRQFADVQDEWLDLMWTLDQYRIANVPPRGMGKLTTEPGRRLGAIYRGKGNWFAALLALLLQNRTSLRIAPRQKVQGFSQMHQIDLAWPARRKDVRVVAESKVTGAPAYGDTPARGSLSDYSSRRKELKFAATDLKLYRRQQDTAIEHWGVWREQSPPKTYFLWAARLNAEKEKLATLVSEAQALVNTYLDGAGLFAWQTNPAGSGYAPVQLPHSAQVTSLDDVLYRMASEINVLAGPDRKPPPAVTPQTSAVEPETLLPDESS
jgi:hypothetical protein